MIVSPLAERLVPAANCEPRRGGRGVDMLILHYTGMASAEAARELLCSAESGVSCHYLVDESGIVTQMVGEELRAWHAGASSWKGETDTNSRSIGIEIQNPGHALGYADFPARQMASLAALCRDILSRHAIPPAHVLAHSDVAPGRKIDPGEKFAWGQLAAEGIGHWVPPAADDFTRLSPSELLSFQTLLSAYGYAIAPTGEPDEQTRKVTDAFQRHFRQSLVNGVPDVSALRTAERLLAAGAA
ncbi:N-acetylmuramoyl-L-alanine amidase [Aestuariivirga sp.]|uniref:N-acetylmuramoyl-L-alanine amidase n=1 Tax=Aestuariivirga sp. TaxID=2650926 RepID=UPI00391A6F88